MCLWSECSHSSSLRKQWRERSGWASNTLNGKTVSNQRYSNILKSIYSQGTSLFISSVWVKMSNWSGQVLYCSIQAHYVMFLIRNDPNIEDWELNRINRKRLLQVNILSHWRKVKNYDYRIITVYGVCNYMLSKEIRYFVFQHPLGEKKFFFKCMVHWQLC